MFKKSIAAIVVAGFSALASAATFDLVSSPTGELAIDGVSKNYTFDASVADPSAKLNFVLDLYRTVDGYNGGFYIDIFSLVINNKLAFQGTYQGAGGVDGNASIDFGAGSTVTATNSTVTVSNLAFDLKQGKNTFSFTYVPLTGTQGINDEAWGLQSASIAAVPEPETYAMFLAGLGLMGAVARRRARS